MPRKPRATVPLKTTPAGSLPLELLFFLGDGNDFFMNFTDRAERPDPLGKRVIPVYQMKDPEAMRQTYFAHKRELFAYAEKRHGQGSKPYAYRIFEEEKGNQ